MDHESVKVWILADDSTDAASKLAEAHLATCAECRAFAARWAAARQVLAAPVVVNPESGFSQRWFARLESSRRLRHHRQAALTICVTALGAAGSFALMAWSILDAPASAVGSVLEALVSLDVQFRVVLESLRIVLNTLPPLASTALLSFAAAAALGLILVYTSFSALWTASFYQAVLHTRTKEI
jgi:predicted anti-sigma-YlaC factor YlaD